MNNASTVYTVATLVDTPSVTNANVTVTDYSTLPSHAGGYVFARAASISGFTPSAGDKWCVELGTDGTSLVVKRLGLTIFVR